MSISNLDLSSLGIDLVWDRSLECDPNLRNVDGGSLETTGADVSGFLPTSSGWACGASSSDTVVVHPLFRPRPATAILTPQEDQNVTLAENLLGDSLSYVQCCGRDYGVLEGELVALMDDLNRAKRRKGSVDAVLAKVIKIHDRIEDLKALESLHFAKPNRTGLEPVSPVAEPPVVAAVRGDLVRSIVGDDDDLYLDAMGRLETLKRYEAHLEHKTETANRLREAAPITVREGVVQFSLSYEECSGPQATSDDNLSDTPCGNINEHPFYRTLWETDAVSRDRLQKGFSAIFSDASLRLLFANLRGGDPFGEMEETMTNEQAVLAVADFPSFLKHVAELQERSSEMDALFNKRAYIAETASDIVAYDNTIDLIDRSLAGKGPDLSTKADSMLDALIEDVQNLAAVVRSVPRFSGEDVTDIYGPEGFEDFHNDYRDSTTKIPVDMIGVDRPLYHDFKGDQDTRDSWQVTLERIRSSDLSLENKLRAARVVMAEVRAQSLFYLDRWLYNEKCQVSRGTLDETYTVGEPLALQGGWSMSGASALAQSQAILTEADDAALANGILDGINMFSDMIKDIEDGFLFGLIEVPTWTGGFKGALEELNRAQDLLWAGKKEEARAVFLGVVTSPHHRYLLNLYAQHQETEGIATNFVKNVAITIASAGVGTVFAAPARAYAAIQRWGAVRTLLATSLAGGTGFYMTQQTLQGSWGDSSVVGHVVGWAETVALFFFLEGGMALFDKGAKALVVARTEAALGVKLTEAQANAAFKAWIKTAPVLKQVAYHTSRFGFENVTLLAFEMLKTAVHEWTINPVTIGGKVLSGEMIVQQMFFLCFLRLGITVAQPIVKPAVGLTTDAVLGNKAPQYKALTAEGESLAKEMETYYAEVLSRKRVPDPAITDGLLARYEEFMQKRATFIRGLPEGTVAPEIKADAEADAGQAGVMRDAAETVAGIKLKQVGANVFAADRATIEALRNSGETVVDEGNGVYSFGVGGNKIYVTTEVASAPAARGANRAGKRKRPQRSNWRFEAGAVRFGSVAGSGRGAPLPRARNGEGDLSRSPAVRLHSTKEAGRSMMSGVADEIAPPMVRERSDWMQDGRIDFRPAATASEIPMLLIDGRPAKFLGAGANGDVFVDPTNPNHVIKFFRDAGNNKIGEEFDSLTRLADLGAAPRPIAWDVVGGEGQGYLVVERIHGWTVDALEIALEKGKVTPEQEIALRVSPEEIRGLIDRLAADGVFCNDMNVWNVMVGRTAHDQAPRAYLVDAGWLGEAKFNKAELREIYDSAFHDFLLKAEGFFPSQPLRASDFERVDRWEEETNVTDLAAKRD